MAKEKAERNRQILLQVKDGVPYSNILHSHSLKSKKSIYIIVKRDLERKKKTKA